MPALTFLEPLFLAGLLAVAIPILLHLRRDRMAPERQFSAVQFVEASAIETTRTRRWTDLLLLALRVAALVVLALAFARPYFDTDAMAGSAICLSSGAGKPSTGTPPVTTVMSRPCRAAALAIRLARAKWPMPRRCWT